MKTRRKPKNIALRASVPTLKSGNLPGLDLGTLQADFVASRRALKSAAGILARAQDALDAARAAYAGASEKLKAASRAVLAEA